MIGTVVVFTALAVGFGLAGFIRSGYARTRGDSENVVLLYLASGAFAALDAVALLIWALVTIL